MSRSSRRSPADAVDFDRRKLWTDRARMAAAVLVGMTAGVAFCLAAVVYVTMFLWTGGMGGYVALVLSLLFGVPAFILWRLRRPRMRAFAVGFSVVPIAFAVWVLWSILTIPDFLG